VPQHAAVKSSLSVRSRQLSQRRANREQEPVDLTHQDRPMDRESWVGEHGQQYEEEEAHAHSTMAEGGQYGEENSRGREMERPVVA
jgi:hypothetical protein